MSAAEGGEELKVMDWSLCCLCQGDVIDDLRCPANKECYNSAYYTLQKDLLDFDSINALPDALSLERLNDGSGIAKTLLTKKAKYHKSCRTMLNRQMFLRAEKSKRKLQHGDVAISPKKTRSSFSACVSRIEPECILCKLVAMEGLHRASNK